MDLLKINKMSEIAHNARKGRTRLEDSRLSNETIYIFNKIYSFLIEKEERYEKEENKNALHNCCYFSTNYDTKGIDTGYFSINNVTNLCFCIYDVGTIFHNKCYIKHKSNIQSCYLRYRNNGQLYTFVIIHNSKFTKADNIYIKCKKCRHFSNYYDKKTETCLIDCEKENKSFL